MPQLTLATVPVRVGYARAGDIPPAGVPRVRLRRLVGYVRPAGSSAPVHEAVIDTGSPLTVIPYRFWTTVWQWREGQEFDVIPFTGQVPSGTVAGVSFPFRYAVLRQPLDLFGRMMPGPHFRLESLAVQLEDTPADGQPGLKDVILGLAALQGCSIRIAPRADADDLTAFLDFY